MKKTHAATKHKSMKRHMGGEDSKREGMMNMLKAQGRTRSAPKPLMNQMGPGLQMPEDVQMTSMKNKAQKEKPIMVKKAKAEHGQGNAQANQSVPKKGGGVKMYGGHGKHKKKGY